MDEILGDWGAALKYEKIMRGSKDENADQLNPLGTLSSWIPSFGVL